MNSVKSGCCKIENTKVVKSKVENYTNSNNSSKTNNIILASNASNIDIKDTAEKQNIKNKHRFFNNYLNL